MDIYFLKKFYERAAVNILVCAFFKNISVILYFRNEISRAKIMTIFLNDSLYTFKNLLKISSMKIVSFLDYTYKYGYVPLSLFKLLSKHLNLGKRKVKKHELRLPFGVL